MSLWNNYSNMTPSSIAHMNGIPCRAGIEFPLPPDDIHEFWNTWISDSLFDNEVGGWLLLERRLPDLFQHGDQWSLALCAH